jgi:tetratricopeptide (TPR) repeat protein
VKALQLHYERILDGEERFIWKKLGLFGSNLSALACFFNSNSTSQWQQPSSSLPAAEEVWVLAEAAISLFCLGRAEEAFNPSLLAAKKSSDTPYYTSRRTPGKVLPEVTDLCAYNAAVHWGTHSTICLALGQISLAISAGQTAVESAERSGDTFRRIYNRCILGDAYHQAADIESALRCFREAEQFQIAKNPDDNYLDSIKGYLYCDLLLRLGETGEVKKRAEKALATPASNDSLVATAFQYLALARCYPVGSTEAEEYYITAIQGLRNGGNQIYLSRGLLFRAAYYRQLGNYEKARQCVDEVREKATSSGSKLLMTDLQIEQGYLLIHNGEKEKGVERFIEAEQMMNDTGYHRREHEVHNCLVLYTRGGRHAGPMTQKH